MPKTKIIGIAPNLFSLIISGNDPTIYQLVKSEPASNFDLSSPHFTYLIISTFVNSTRAQTR